MSESALLPAGIYDQLAPYAKMHRAVSEALLTGFEQFGYDYVSPPLIEFEEGLLSGSAATLSKDTFRLMDPLSQQMLAVRSDITTQIARIAASRLNESIAPMRLSYAGDVLRVGGNTLSYERQLTQAGIELIGSSDLRADVEVIRVAVEALSGLGIEKITIDFSIPKLKEIILAELKLDDQKRIQLEDAIARKDPKLIQLYGDKQAKLLLALCAPSITLETFLSLSMPRAAKPLAKQLKALCELVHKQIPSLHVTIDPLESRNGGYHSGVAFSLFARGAKGEIGRGGRYQIAANQAGRAYVDAVGCSLYVNLITTLLPSTHEAERIFIPLGTSENIAHDLRQEGYVTIYATSDSKDIAGEAHRQRCNKIWQKDKAVSV